MIEQPDPAVLRRARQGDKRAFTIIVRQHERRLFNFILRSVQERALAEELMQDVYLRAFRALPSFSGSSFASWLFQIANNRIIDELRVQHRHPSPISLDAELAATVDGSVDAREQLETIWAAIGELALDLRNPLLLRDIAGLSYAEIAETLALSLPTVRLRIFLARQQLIELLRAAGEELPAGPKRGLEVTGRPKTKRARSPGYTRVSASSSRRSQWQHQSGSN